MHGAYADISTHVNFTADARGILSCNTSETTVNWVRHSPARKRISYQNYLLPSQHGKYNVTGVKLTVNNVTGEDAGEYHCETPDYVQRFFVAVQLQGKEV